MVDDLNRVESDRAVILAGISHDLRTPISRMLLEVEMANFETMPRAGMQADLGQMDAIIGQFLEYARQSDNAPAASVDLSSLLTECAHETERLNDVRISAEIAVNVNVFGNATDLKRVFTNLLENARRYGKTENTNLSEIDIACKTEGNHAVIEVTDSGPGIPEEEMERLLRPFTRLDTARGQANGSGLGLAIVERIMKRHHGSLKLSNKSGGGLRVRIAIPITGALG